LLQRADDAPEAVTKRLAVYRRETLPVVQFFKSRYAHLTQEVSVEPSTDAACQALRDIVGGLHSPKPGSGLPGDQLRNVQ
jgi:adenylate kinase family enzyme